MIMKPTRSYLIEAIVAFLSLVAFVILTMP